MLLHVIAAFALLQGQTSKPTFAQTVLGDFVTWDTDRDGILSRVEIDRAALNPANKGADAAALAALHSWLEADKAAAPKLTKDWFESYKPGALRIKKGTPAEQAKALRKVFSASPESLQRAFSLAVRRLSKKREELLFADAGPELTDIRQGALGDCYMLAPLGALVHRNPSDVKNMITPSGDGFDVAFGDGEKVHVIAPTDAELAMGGSATTNGLWIRVVEKAYGSRKLSPDSEKIATDSMHGGSGAIAGKAFTGHKFASIKLIGDYKKDVPASTIQEKMTILRKAIASAEADRRLMVASTPKHEMPKSISPNHAYAVFGYDPKTDLVTIWNPHGNTFKPKGDEGPEYGYSLDHGVFSMPLEMFVRTFGRIIFENKS